MQLHAFKKFINGFEEKGADKNRKKMALSGAVLFSQRSNQRFFEKQGYSGEVMVHPGGFEPPTARFVAEYSIQLSYGCIGEMLRYYIY